MLIDILLVFLVVFALLILAVGVLCLVLSMPLSDLLNMVARNVGLAGPSPETRAVGVHGRGTVAEPFSQRSGERCGTGKVFVKGELWNALCDAAMVHELNEGDTVEIVYNDDLTVTVLRKEAR